MKKIIYLFALLFPLFSCEEIIMEADISNENVNLVAPVNNAQFSSTGITFTWNPIENITSYRIQVAKPNFANPMQIIVDDITEEHSFTTQLNIGEYEWRVQGVNSGYQTAYSSRFLTIINNDDFASNVVRLSLPENNKITNNPVQNLSWQPVIGATGYTLQIFDNDNATIINEQNLNSTSLNYTFTQGSFLWKVQATNGTQNTLYSSRSILIDITPPAVPQLVLPANLSNSSNNTVTFQWTRTPIPGSAETDKIYIYSDSALTNLIYSNEATSPYTSSVLANGTYYWYVRAYDSAGNTGVKSTVYSFTLN